ncbi:hypothetical protein [uncultured Spirosoma sp.]|uniref:hypothetical protein n=1 Tax=uncultured Spirosoma sp. TaxID=278208 RepID=UPI00258C0CB3|nr:hypothetical protein [uncultured Spirosoma sp.]
MAYSSLFVSFLLAGFSNVVQAQCIVKRDTHQVITTTCLIAGLKAGIKTQVYEGSAYLTYPIWQIGAFQLDAHAGWVQCPIKFDVSSQEVYCELEEGKATLVNPSQFVIGDHRFLNLPAYVLGHPIKQYYELLNEGKTKLLVQRKRVLISSFTQNLNGYTVLVKTRPNETSGPDSQYSGRYEEKLVYYLQRPAERIKPIELTGRSLLKALPNSSPSIKALLSNTPLTVAQVVKAIALYDNNFSVE